MAIIALKAWYLKEYEPIRELIKRPPDIRLSKNSLLKSALRADFLEDSEEVRNSVWFGRYLEGSVVEFYIEGSGGYAISNIDLTSHEIYFTKQEVMSHLDPIIFLCYQTEYTTSSEALSEELDKVVSDINRRSRLTISVEGSHRPSNAPIRLKSKLMGRIRKSLLFVADGTAIAQVAREGGQQLIPSPNVCVEMGYALKSKRWEQILLVQQEREDMPGQFPFDLPSQNRLLYKNRQELSTMLPQTIETLLLRFNLLS